MLKSAIYLISLMILGAVFSSREEHQHPATSVPSESINDNMRIKMYVDGLTRKRNRGGKFNDVFFNGEHVSLIFNIESINDPAKGKSSPQIKSLTKAKLDSTFYKPLDSTSYKRKVGSMPDVNFPGSFIVIYMDDSWTELGRYTMWSPFYQRVESPGPGGKGIRKVKKGYFEVPLPMDKPIATVVFAEVLKDDTVTLSAFDVRPVFMNIKSRPKQ